MRISTDEQDKLGYVCWPLNDLEVVFNGHVVGDVSIADDKEDFVVALNLDLAVPEVRYGKVEFRAKNEAGQKLLGYLRKRWSILAPQYPVTA